MKKIFIVMLLSAAILCMTSCANNNSSSSLNQSSMSSTEITSSSDLPLSSSDITYESEEIDEEEARKLSAIQEYKSIRDFASYNSCKKLDQESKEDILCIVGDYELHLRTVESFSGDTYEFGVFDKTTENWVLPYSDEYTIIKNFISISDFLEQRIGSVTFYDLGEGVIYIKEFITTWGYNSRDWCYDFLNDRLVELDDEPIKYYNNKIIMGTSTSTAKVYDFQTGETHSFIKSSGDSDHRYYPYRVFHNSILIEKAKKGRYGYQLECYQLYDFDGNLLFDLSGYDLPYDYLSKANYNNDKLFFVANGKDSGIYACLIDKDGNLLFDPVKVPDESGKTFYLFVLDDCAVTTLISFKKSDYGLYTRTVDSVTDVFYEFDGTEFFSYIEKASNRMS